MEAMWRQPQRTFGSSRMIMTIFMAPPCRFLHGAVELTLREARRIRLQRIREHREACYGPYAVRSNGEIDWHHPRLSQQELNACLAFYGKAVFLKNQYANAAQISVLQHELLGSLNVETHEANVVLLYPIQDARQPVARHLDASCMQKTLMAVHRADGLGCSGKDAAFLCDAEIPSAVAHSAVHECGVACTVLQLHPIFWIGFEQHAFPGAANLEQECIGARYAIICTELNKSGLDAIFYRTARLLFVICSMSRNAASTAAEKQAGQETDVLGELRFVMLFCTLNE